MALGKLLKTGAVALGAVSGVAGAVTTVVNVVEVINYEDHYEINRTTKYYVDGVEVDLATYNELAGFDVGYGKVKDTENITLDDFTAVRLNGTTDTFTCKIVCGDPVEEVGEFPVFAIPTTYVIDEIKVGGFDWSDNFDLTVIEDYNVYVYNTAVYDEDVGGETWTVSFIEAE